MGGRTRARQAWRVLTALVAGTLVASFLTLAGETTATAAADDLLEFVGYWPIGVDDQDTMVVDPVGETVISLRNASTDFTITVYDASGAPLGSHQVSLALTGTRQNPLGGNPPVAAMVPGTQVLHVVAYLPHVGLRAVSAAPRLLAFDVSDPAAITKIGEQVITGFPAGVQPFGISVDADSQRLYVVGQLIPTMARAFNVYIGEFDVSNPAALVPTLPPVPVRGCQRVIADKQPAAIVKAGEYVFIGCAPSVDVLGSNPVGISSSIQAVHLTDPSRSRAHFLAGSYVKGESFVDLAAGESGRLVLVGSAPGRPGQAVWNFDLAHQTMVGQIAADDIRAAGADVSSGRVVVVAEKSILIGSDRGVPPPGNLPPIPLSSFVDEEGQPRFEATVAGQVVALPFADAVIIPVKPSGQSTAEYAVLRDLTTEDHLRPGQPTDFASLDLEETGVDAPNELGDAQAFGFRVHVLGGVSHVRSNADGADPNWWTEKPFSSFDDLPSMKEATGIDDGDRDLQFARVIGATLSQDEAAARAINFDTGERTRSDYTNLTQRQRQLEEGQSPYPSDPEVEGDAWPFDLAQCGVFATGDAEATGENAEWAAGSPASVTCDMDQGSVVATTDFGGIDPAGLTGLVSVGASRSETTLERDPETGISVVSFAEARNVTIGGLVEIGRVTSTATVDAFGGHENLEGELVEPGSASATYERTFENVRAGDFSCAECDPTEVVAEITSILGTQFRVEIPSVEELATEGGAHAHAWREPWELRQDVLVNQQVETQREVPALRVSFIGDLDLPSRVIFEFAATKAEAKRIRTRDVPPEPDFDFTDDSGDEVFTEVVGEPVEPVAAVPPVERTIVLGEQRTAELGEATDAAVVDAAPPGQSFLEQVLERGGEWVRRALPAMAMTFALFLLFGIPPFLASRRRLLARLISGRS